MVGREKPATGAGRGGREEREKGGRAVVRCGL